MRKIAHIINPFLVDKASDLFIAQPITLETMKVAKKFSRGQVEVDLFTAQYPEDRALVPEGFRLTPDLDRSVLDLGSFQKKRKLPLLADILDRLYEAADAEYLIYTNVDIALLPHFYVSVNAFIEKGYDAFVVNRRTIEAIYSSPAEIPWMYAEAGTKHLGFDCFVFKREAYPQYKLSAVCLGIPWVNHVLLCNLICQSQNFFVFRKLHLTFHLGDSQVWLKEKYADYYAYNRDEARKAHAALEQIYGPLEQVTAFARNGVNIERPKQLLHSEENAEVILQAMKKRMKKIRQWHAEAELSPEIPA
jgi:hypothetical protein